VNRFFGFHGAEKVLNFECVIWVGTLELCVCIAFASQSHCCLDSTCDCPEHVSRQHSSTAQAHQLWWV